MPSNILISINVYFSVDLNRVQTSCDGDGHSNNFFTCMNVIFCQSINRPFHYFNLLFLNSSNKVTNKIYWVFAFYFEKLDFFKCKQMMNIAFRLIYLSKLCSGNTIVSFKELKTIMFVLFNLSLYTLSI